MKYKLKNSEFFKKLLIKIVIIHGLNDEIIDISHSINLSKILKNEDKFYKIDTTHNILGKIDEIF